MISPLLLITLLYHCPESFMIRSWLAKSVYTSPNRLEYPDAHSKLSVSAQWKYPSTGIPSRTASRSFRS